MKLLIVSTLVGGVLGAGAAWKWQSNSYTAQISALQTTYAQQQHRAVETAHAQTIQLQERKDEAIKKSETRLKLVAADARRSADALGLLHQAADSAIRAAETSHTACIERTAALGDVFKSCSQAVTALGKTCDGHVSDVKTLIDAWPTQNASP